MKTALKIAIFLVLCSFSTPIRTIAAPLENDARELLNNWLEPVAGSGSRISADPLEDPLNALARFYQRRDYQLAWVDNNGLQIQAEWIITKLHHASDDGLDEMDYSFQILDAELNSNGVLPDSIAVSEAGWLVRLDASITGALLRYAAHLSGGRVQPEEISGERFFPQAMHHQDLPGEIAGALQENRLETFLASLRPKQRQYQELKKALGRYRQIETDGGWPEIPAGPNLESGDTSPRVAVLRRHLAIAGDLKDNASTADDFFDPALEAAVKSFQGRHGLPQDGVVGKGTLAALNVPVKKRILQLTLNMERWRWLPEDFGPRYLIVNIPAYELKLVEDGQVALTMRAIVGKKRRQTPVLYGQMTYLELNPYWNIPPKIARKDILPKVKEDPEYLSRQRIQVFSGWGKDAPELDPLTIDWANVSERAFPYRLRQVPTEVNALGRVKFMFPNPHSVYIHDTPSKSLFNKSRRIFSSGCVRVEEPMALAAHLLKPQQWDDQRLEATLEAGRRRTVVLKRPIPVYLFYLTAWIDSDSGVNFREDVYNRDQRLQQALAKESTKIYLCGTDAQTDRRPLVCMGPQI